MGSKHSNAQCYSQQFVINLYYKKVRTYNYAYFKMDRRCIVFRFFSKDISIQDKNLLSLCQSQKVAHTTEFN